MPIADLEIDEILTAFDLAYERFEREALEVALRKEKADALRWANENGAGDAPPAFFSISLQEEIFIKGCRLLDETAGELNGGGQSGRATGRSDAVAWAKKAARGRMEDWLSVRLGPRQRPASVRPRYRFWKRKSG